MRRRSRVRPHALAALIAALIAAPLTLAVAPRPLGAQGDARVSSAEQPDLLVQGLDLEQQGKHAAAAGLYRRALATPHAVSAMLGLERVYAELGWGDSTLAVVDSMIRASPRNPTYRTIQLRTLRTAGRESQARDAFERWVQAAPRDVAPFREWARLLLQDGRTAGADSVLQRAELVLGSTRGLATEVAQLRAAMGLWDAAARSWREAVQEQDYMFQAAAFSLQPAPEAERARIRRVLLAPPVEPGARRITAALELAWGNARDGWLALRELPPDDEGMQAWRDFAELAEGNEAWSAAAEAFAALYQRKRDPELAARAARAALQAGLPATAADVTGFALGRTDSTRAARLLVVPHVEALTALGRAEEADRTVRAWASRVAPEQRIALDRAVAWGWVRARSASPSRGSRTTRRSPAGSRCTKATSPRHARGSSTSSARRATSCSRCRSSCAPGRRVHRARAPRSSRSRAATPSPRSRRSRRRRRRRRTRRPCSSPRPRASGRRAPTPRPRGGCGNACSPRMVPVPRRRRRTSSWAAWRCGPATARAPSRAGSISF